MTQITLLDGGMGQELIARAGGVATPLWSTQALLDDPTIVGDVHQSYAEAGATVATTNTYALHRDRLLGGSSNHYAADDLDLPDLTADQDRLIQAALTQAAQVRGTCRIAGSIGPLGASYRADIAQSSDAYFDLVKRLAPDVDLLIFETIASKAAAEACLEAGRRTALPVWLAFTVDDADGSRLRSDEPLAELKEIGAQADAVLANCSLPEVMPAALTALAQFGVSFGAYANGFTKISKEFIDGGATADEALSARQDLSPETYAAHALTWAKQGATIVGGCCEVGPAHIAAVARRLKTEGYTLS